jgi:acetyl esterase/lipase
VAAAVAYARGEGARRVVLFDYSMGGGVMANYLLQTAEAGGPFPDAVVLDAPMLDLRATVEHGIVETPVLGWFADALTWTIEFRLQQDFGVAAYVEG